MTAIAAVLVVAGAALGMLAGLGVLRFPDVFSRMHAATKPATLGLVVLALGAAIAADSVNDVARLALVVALQFLTAPAGAHLVGRAAAQAGVARDRLVVDDLHPKGSSPP